MIDPETLALRALYREFEQTRIRPHPHRHLASCPACRCLVLAVRVRVDARFGSGTIVWDPSFVDRRMVRSAVPRSATGGQQFGLIYGGFHECPPVE